jgi:hypothetical protein
MHRPTTIHWAAVKHILRYLNGTSLHGITISPSDTLTFYAYYDAEWAGYPDDCRSASGFCVYLGNTIISWSQKKQPTIAQSSTGAEYRSLAITSS